MDAPVQASDHSVDAWSRRRLVAILVTAVLAATTALGTLGYAVSRALSGITDGDTPSANADPGLSPSSTPTGPSSQTRRDDIAAALMLSVPGAAAHPTYPSGPSDPASRAASSGVASIDIPLGTATPGPAFVMSGFPRTPEGAIGQLAQIDVAVLQSMSLVTAHEVYASWALPGGATDDAWWITASVRAFLDGASMTSEKDTGAWIQVEPAAAQVKGVDGSDWATVCVLLRITATYRSDGAVALGHCERMQWVGGRWMIAPGTPPALAPSTWPDTPLAAEAGWLSWATDTTPITASAPSTAPSFTIDVPESASPDEAGAVATAAAVARSQVGFDYRQASAAAVLAAPDERATYEEQARTAVRLRRARAGLEASREPQAPASYAATPIAYQSDLVAPDLYAVHLLNWITLTTTAAEVRDHLQVDTILLAWSEGWRLTTPDAATMAAIDQARPPVPDANDIGSDISGWTLFEGMTGW